MHVKNVFTYKMVHLIENPTKHFARGIRVIWRLVYVKTLALLSCQLHLSESIIVLVGPLKRSLFYWNNIEGIR